MFVRSRLAAALTALGILGAWACRGENYVVIPRDGGADTAVSASWLEQDDAGVMGSLGGSSNASGANGSGGASGAGSGGILDAAVATSDAASPPLPPLPPTPCALDSDCFDSDPCNGLELCSNGFCVRGTPVACNDGSSCTRDVCDSNTGQCVFTPLGNGTPCSATNKCDGEVCLEGVCTPGPAPVCGDDGNVCTQQGCDPATGACAVRPFPDGTSCDDGSVCNGRESCQQGVCRQSTAPNCDDHNPCTLDTCDAVQGCLHLPVGDGTSCADGNQCNGIETCHSGICQSGPPLVCNDGSPCTVDTCNPATGVCRFTPLANGVACPDGNLCDGQKCQDGLCVTGAPVVCASDNDGNPCTTTSCNPVTGSCSAVAVANGTPCPDADLCNGTETCVNGACVGRGTPLLCPDDNNPCTDDVCAPAAGCLHLNRPNGSVCADSNLCDGVETCQAGVCANNGTPVVCDDHNPCTVDSCSPDTGACVSTILPNGTPCPDADKCNGTEVCGNGVCLLGTPVRCDDGNPCTTDSCTPATGACVSEPAPNGTLCNDGNACNGTETCGNGICLFGTPILCSSPSVCNITTGLCEP